MAVVRNSKIDLQINGTGAYAFIAQPDDDEQHPGVVLIQEWWGIEPHILDLANRLAADGFVVAVPDLYHGKVATEPDDARRMAMFMHQNIERAVNEIIGALDTLKAQPNVQPKRLGLMGFCIGGFLTLTTAAHYPDLGAAIAFYPGGYDPSPEEVAKVQAPVLTIFGSQDDGIPQGQREKIESVYTSTGKDFSIKVYDAGHAFLNPEHGMGNDEAAADAWPRAVNFLKNHLR